MRKPINSQEVFEKLPKSYQKVVNQLNSEVEFINNHIQELRVIFYHCKQAAKLQTDLEIRLGRIKSEERLERIRATEDELFKHIGNNLKLL